jgi:hypothetical protein
MIYCTQADILANNRVNTEITRLRQQNETLSRLLESKWLQSERAKDQLIANTCSLSITLSVSTTIPPQTRSPWNHMLRARISCDTLSSTSIYLLSSLHLALSTNFRILYQLFGHPTQIGLHPQHLQSSPNVPKLQVHILVQHRSPINKTRRRPAPLKLTPQTLQHIIHDITGGK